MAKESIAAKRAKNAHYVNNKEFSQAMMEYAKAAAEAKASGAELLPITNYIAECLYKICEGLSYAPNFIRYSYREDMVMDAVENCVRVASNFDITRETRTGLPNAFSYFTQIAYFAFLRRIAKEKKQWDIKLKLIESASLNAFADFGLDENHSAESLVEKMRHRTDVFSRDDSFIDDSEFKPAKKKAAPRGWARKKAARSPITTSENLYDVE